MSCESEREKEGLCKRDFLRVGVETWIRLDKGSNWSPRYGKLLAS